MTRAPRLRPARTGVVAAGVVAAGAAVLGSADGGTRWSVLASPRGLAATAAGRRCSLTGITAVAFGPASVAAAPGPPGPAAAPGAPPGPAAARGAPPGMPVVAGACAAPGTVGVFGHADGTWRDIAPPLPAALAVDRLRVLRMTSLPDGDGLLLEATRASSAWLYSAWITPVPGPALPARTVSAALPLPGGAPRTSGFGPDGAAWVVLPGGHAETIAGPGAAWRPLPPPPGGAATLAAGPGGEVDALAASGDTLTAWRLGPRAGTWREIQEIDVPLQYGSSG